MTGRTHDLAAFTALTFVFINYPMPEMTLATAIVAMGANILGGLTPDIDEPSSKFWTNIPAGSILGRLIHPLLGSHRMISHSLLGLVLIGWLMQIFLSNISTILIVDMNIIWWAFMIGFISHLVLDTFTKDGVPWLFPLPIRFGILPFKALRLTTGGFLEQGLVYPGLFLIECIMVYNNYEFIFSFFKAFVKK